VRLSLDFFAQNLPRFAPIISRKLRKFKQIDDSHPAREARMGDMGGYRIFPAAIATPTKQTSTTANTFQLENAAPRKPLTTRAPTMNAAFSLWRAP
jgi:hypothetical protein